jgi:hypothetical protein
MSVELETRVHRANLIGVDRHLDGLYGDDISQRLLGDINSKKEGRVSEVTDRPEPITIEDAPTETGFGPAPATPPKRRSPALVPAILTAVIAVGVIVALVARSQAPDVADPPVEIAEQFMAARNAHDTETVMSLFSDTGVTIHEWPRNVRQFPDQLEHERVIGKTFDLEECVEQSATRVRCSYKTTNAILEVLEIPPLEGDYYELTIKDGQIVTVFQDGPEHPEFEEAMDGTFFTWVRENHPENAELVVNEGYLHPDSMPLWRQYVPEFVAAMEQAG